MIIIHIVIVKMQQFKINLEKDKDIKLISDTIEDAIKKGIYKD